MIPITEKQITSIKIFPDHSKVKIAWITNVQADEPEEEDEGGRTSNDFSVLGRHRPHKDFVEAMKTLRKYALEIADIDVDNKSIKDWTVCEVQISGDMILNKSRAVMTLAKKVEWSGKVIQFKVSQVTMFPRKDETSRYYNAEKMTKQIEVCIEEAWAYLNGKFEEEINPQLALFHTGPVEV